MVCATHQYLMTKSCKTHRVHPRQSKRQALVVMKVITVLLDIILLRQGSAKWSKPRQPCDLDFSRPYLLSFFHSKGYGLYDSP